MGQQKNQQRSTLFSKILVHAIWLHRYGMGDARIVSSHLLIASILVRAANIVFVQVLCGKAGARTTQEWQEQASMLCNGLFCEVIRHQCGLVGVRVGEAAHPGPPGFVDEELVDCLQQEMLKG